MSDKPTKLKCPTCSKDVEWSDKFPFKPFCSDRCKLIDLGDWANENHSIPGNPGVDEDNDNLLM